MPEGPEIRRAADRIQTAISQQPLTEVFFAFDHLKSYSAALVNSQITRVETFGKAMLIRFDQPLSIYSHNQLYGMWMVRSAHNYPNTQRQLRLAIHTAKKSALLYSASDIAVLDPDQIAAHPFLRNLGPDVLHPETNPNQVIAQLTASSFRRRRLATLLLDQHFLCGLGNYLRSEVLYVAGIHPNLRPIDLTSDQLQGIAHAAITVSRQSYQHNGITNDLDRAKTLKQQGLSRRAYRHHVFTRDGQPCWHCGTLIEKIVMAGRRCYVCPKCQLK